MDVGSIKILLVEDNPGDVRLIKETLIEAGTANIDMTCVEKLRDAINVLDKSKFDIILLDLTLPDSTGFDTFSSVHMKSPDVPIVLLTGMNNEMLAVKALQSGAQDYLIKGQVDSSLLVRSIRYAIERHRIMMELEQVRQKEHHLAYFDMLTDLPNRQLFYDRLSQALSHAQRYKQRIVLMYLDLDGFKLVNDSFGHDVGDMLLKGVAKRLEGCIRKSDTVARMGGDEFTCILSNIKDEREVGVVVKNINKSLELPFDLKGHEVYISSSIGASIFPDDTDDLHILIKNADMAMYHAKKQSKNKFQFFNKNINVTVLERMSMESNLRKALEKDEFELHYQPQVDLKSGKIIGVEALLRWKHPGKGYIPPEMFIPFAEETGQIIPIGEWVLYSACEQARKWIDMGFDSIRVAVNLSAKQFKQERILKLVWDALNETGLSASCLDFEITESSTMHDMDYSIRILRELQEMGSRVSIDDFGTGISSLSYLRSFPANALKIDRSFVRDIPLNNDSTAIANAVIAMAQSLNFEVIAEGVETRNQLDFLCAKNCDAVQGYLFSTPLPAEACTKILYEGVSPIHSC